MAIQTMEELEQIIQDCGFVPMFRNDIYDFSVEESIEPSLWFTDKIGPWEWKGTIARKGNCFYGKFFQGKAGFISKEWMKDYINYRRDGYDYEGRYNDGLSTYLDMIVVNALEQHGPMITTDLKKICNFHKDGNKGFDTVITRLQMQGYVTCSDFVYKIDKHGNEYGWGVSKYALIEQLVDEEYIESAYSITPDKSKQRIFAQLKKIVPHATEAQLYKVIG